MMQGPPVAPGVADAANGRPSVANPGGTGNNSWQMVMDAFAKIDAGIRGLRAVVLQAMPASGKCANQLDKLAYELGKIKGECESDYAEQQSSQMASQAAAIMTQNM